MYLAQACSRHNDLVVGCVPEIISQARKIEEHRRKKERKFEEKLKQTAGEENAQEAKEKKPGKAHEKIDILKLLNDKEIILGFTDPEIYAAFEDIGQDPKNFLKYRSNKKIVSFIEKLAKKLGIAGTATEIYEMMAHMPGFPGRCDPRSFIPKQARPPPPQDDDVGLD
ncbi:hypothetical protein M0802_006061 [Mischocyttarus mexicanus]|nr:hypothetical protein M0802_016815 [Mischocyttarus mexicanus]KAI4498886.1 hypothetical protein M0802_006061 [Mischocyttarus mexicanus]